MAQYNQVVRDAFSLDRTVKNTDTVVISAGTAVQIDSSTYSTTPDPIPVKNIATSDDESVFWGVAVEDIAAGAVGRVCRFGSVVAIAGTGGVTINDDLVMDSLTGQEGRVKKVADAVAHTGSGVGKAEQTAAVGEYVKIFINHTVITTA